MAVSLIVDTKKIVGSQLLTSLFADSFGITATSNKARVSAVLAQIKGKSTKQLVKIIDDSTAPTHVEFINPDDDRTSDICKPLVDKVWKIGDPNIKVPPLHFNCRSSLSYIRQ